MNSLVEQESLPHFEKTIIALDVGRSAVKAFALFNGTKFPLVFPSIVAREKKLADDETTARIAHEIVAVDGVKYFTGESARLYGQAESNAGLTNDWTDSDEYKALVLGAFSRFSQMGIKGLEDCYVVVGTPSDHYLSGRTELEENTTAVLKGATVKALSQPIGVYLSYVLDPKGVSIPDRNRDAMGRKASWLIIEVGQYDTGFMYIKEGAHQQDRDDIAEGISAAVYDLKRILKAQKKHLDILECDEALRTGKLLEYGQYTSIASEVADAVAPVARNIIKKAGTLFAEEARKVNGILLAGGGGNCILYSLREQWKNVIVLEEPRMAVAEGYLRYAISVMSRRVKEQHSIKLAVANG